VKFRRWWWLLVPCFGLFEWAAHAYFASRPPRDAEWDELLAVVTELGREGTLVVVAPHWAEPHARRVLGDRWMPLAHVARAENSTFATALEISILGADSELEDWRVVETRQAGKFRLRVLENPAPQTVLFDFVGAIEQGRARVESVRGKGDSAESKPCSWNERARVANGALHGHPTFPKRRFECQDGNWHFVGSTVIEDQSYRGRRCIWAQPGQGKQTRIVFEGVTLGDRIVGHGALPYFLERESDGTPVELTVSVAGELLGKFRHEDGEGWKRFEFSTAQYAGQTHDVEFTTSSKRSHQREFCFQADVR
jgi:hypothetical protein